MLHRKFTTEGFPIRGFLCEAVGHPHLLIPMDTSWAIYRKQNGTNLYEEILPSVSPEGLQDWLADNCVNLPEEVAYKVLNYAVDMLREISFGAAAGFLAAGRPPIRHGRVRS